MLNYDAEHSRLAGPHGHLDLPEGDPASRKLAMLLAGECMGRGPVQAARDFGYTKARYYQLKHAFAEKGLRGLINRKTGPKRNYRRTPEATKLVIRARFLDPDASEEVIASKLTQDGHPISVRSVARIFSEYGLQKKSSIFRSRKPSRA